jgi:hypothetical protein
MLMRRITWSITVHIRIGGGGGKLSFGVTQSGLELAGNELQQGLLANAHGLPTGLLERGRYLECDCVIWKGSVVGE